MPASTVQASRDPPYGGGTERPIACLPSHTQIHKGCYWGVLLITLLIAIDRNLTRTS